MNYPFTKKIENIDDYFGVKVRDDYTWLEELNSSYTNFLFNNQIYPLTLNSENIVL
jgi:hypothetical protein